MTLKDFVGAFLLLASAVLIGFFGAIALVAVGLLGQGLFSWPLFSLSAVIFCLAGLLCLVMWVHLRPDEWLRWTTYISAGAVFVSVLVTLGAMPQSTTYWQLVQLASSLIR